LEDLAFLWSLRVDNNYLDTSAGSSARLFLDALRAGNAEVIDAPQHRFELNIARVPGGVRLVYQGFRGLRYDLQATTTLMNWPSGNVQSSSGADAELSYNSSIFESARFFRLRIFEEP